MTSSVPASVVDQFIPDQRLPLLPFQYRPGAASTMLGALTEFPSNVTAPLRATARPSSSEEPVPKLTLAIARMLPLKIEPVFKVAELPTCQKIFGVMPAPAPETITEEVVAVVRVLPIWNTKAAFGSAPVSRVSAPVRPADVLK